MKTRVLRSSRARGGAVSLLLASWLLPAAPLRAQVPPPPAAPAQVLQAIGIDQRLGAQVDLGLEFKDERGQPIALGACFGEKPVVLALIYYRCPMLCTMSLNGMLAAFKSMRLEVGRDFVVATVSFDPRETPDLAAAKKDRALAEYARPGAAAGWHFLTGDEEPIRRLAGACGFRYHYDPRTDQYAHASGIMVLTPQGQVSRYFYGVEYSPRDLQLGLVEASAGRVGNLVDQVLLLCYRYDPATGRYGLAIMTVLRAGSLLTLLALGGFIVVAVRRERRARGPRRPEGGPKAADRGAPAGGGPG